MGKKRCILLAVMLVALLGGWGSLVSHQAKLDPVYQGKPLSYWLRVYDPATGIGVESNTAEQLWRQLGTNTIPTLFRLLRSRDSALKLKFVGLVQKQHFIRVRWVPASEWHEAALKGFCHLGDSAKDAAGTLVEICEQNISPSSQSAIVSALGCIGPVAKETVPLLIQATSNPNPEVRCKAITAFCLRPAEPGLVVPTLVSCLHDVDPTVRRIAAYALPYFGPDAKPAVPTLVETLKDRDKNVNLEAGRSLKLIDPEAAAKAGVK